MRVTIIRITLKATTGVALRVSIGIAKGLGN